MPIPGMKPENNFPNGETPGREKCSECGCFYETEDMHHLSFYEAWLCEACMEAVTEAAQEDAAEDQYMQQHQGGYGG